jgi:hypothetical protein
MRIILKTTMSLIFACMCTALLAADVSFDFYKESHEGQEVEKVYGYMYIKAAKVREDNCVYIHVTNPVNQIIEYKKDATTFYYPEEKKAIILLANPARPGINAMDPAAKKLDLKNSGMALVRAQKIQGGTRETWAPKKIIGAPVKEIDVEKTDKGAVSMIEIKDKAGKTVSRMKYGDFADINGIKMPLFIETFSMAGGEAEYENINLSRPDDKTPLPPEIKDFTVPKGAEIEKVKF